MTPSEKQKEIAVAFAAWLDQQRNDPTWKDQQIWDNNQAYQLLLNDWLLTEEGKRLTAEEEVESPQPSLDALIEIAKSMVQMSEHQLSIKKQLDRFEGRLRGDLFRD